MNLTFENIFLGAKVSLEKIDLFIYKINIKTFYAGVLDYEVFLEKYENKSKEFTFKDFCKNIKAKQYDYAGFTIADAEVEKGKKIGSKKKNKDEKRYLSVKGEKILRDACEKYKKGKSFNYPMYDDKTEFHILIVHPDGKALINIEDNYYLYNLVSKKFFFIEDVYKGILNENNIPWDLSI